MKKHFYFIDEDCVVLAKGKKQAKSLLKKNTWGKMYINGDVEKVRRFSRYKNGKIHDISRKGKSRIIAMF